MRLCCTFVTIKHQIQLFNQQVRTKRKHCKFDDSVSPIFRLRVDEELFASLEVSLQAIVVCLSEYTFFIKNFYASGPVVAPRIVGICILKEEELGKSLPQKEHLWKVFDWALFCRWTLRKFKLPRQVVQKS